MIAEAYRGTWDERTAVLRAAGLWVLLSLLGELLSALAGSGEGETGAPSTTGLVALPFLLVGWIGLGALTVHRIRVRLAGDPPPALMAPFDRYVVRYVLVELAVGALAMLPSLPAVALLGPIGGLPLALAAGLAVALFLFARLHLVLTAAALGERIALERSWRVTAGVWPQAAVGLLACSMPLALASGALGAVVGALGAPLTGSAVGTVGAFAQAAVLGAFLAQSWVRLTGGPADAGA